jgi:chorismate synthase
MANLRFLTSGESHGKTLIGILEGVPSGLLLSSRDIDIDLSRRQKGHGRGGRMKIESDAVQILSGVRWGRTIGSPITLLIENRDWPNWTKTMSVLARDRDPSVFITRPRPGHADLSGALKYGHQDLRNVLERSSARETAVRVALGAIARKFLSEFDINIMSSVVEIGGIPVQSTELSTQITDITKFQRLSRKAESSPVRCYDKAAEKKMVARINSAMRKGDSLGGTVEVVATGVPAGIGSYSQWDRKLDARLSGALMGVQAIKGVETGFGFEMSRRFGSEVMDEIFYTRSKRVKGKRESKSAERETAGGFYRKTNYAGGIEGGMSNGMPIILRAAMKPIPTLRNPLSSVDIMNKRSFKALYERSDICAVPAVAVIGEAVAALVIADGFLEKFGGDSMEEVKRNYKGYMKQMEKF